MGIDKSSRADNVSKEMIGCMCNEADAEDDNGVKEKASECRRLTNHISRMGPLYGGNFPILV